MMQLHSAAFRLLTSEQASLTRSVKALLNMSMPALSILLQESMLTVSRSKIQASLPTRMKTDSPMLPAAIQMSSSTTHLLPLTRLKAKCKGGNNNG